MCERNGPIPGKAGNVPFPLPHLKILSTLFTWPQNGVWRWCPLHNFTDFVLIPHPPNDQCFRCQLELFIGGNIFVCFSLKVSRIRPSSLRPRCVTCCVLSAICWTGHLCPPAQGTTVSSPNPVLFLESVLIKCASWTNSFLLISYFLRDFLFQTFSLIFIFTTIFLLLKFSVYLSPNNWISWWRHLRTVRVIENCCYHLN